MAQQEIPRPPILLVSRSATNFLLQSVGAINRHVEGDILGGITLFALLQGHYAQPAAKGDAARSVSVQSLARSLRTPPETMRRCIARLIALGWCERAPGKGIVIAQSDAARTKIDLLLAEARTAFFGMLAELRRIDFDFDIMGQAVEEKAALDLDVKGGAQEGARPAAERGPALDRIMLDFGLRIVDGASPALGHDYSVACIFSAILAANASPFAFNPREAWRYGTREQMAPDEVRRGATVTEVSQMLNVPYETARRHVNALLACGDVVRDERKGLIIPTNVLMSPRMIATSSEILRRFVEMVGELKRQGFDFRTLDAKSAGY